METLTTALSTLSLNIIDSDDSTLQKGRRDSSSRLVRTYSNCSYAMVGTFRHPAERRTTTLPAVRGRQTAGGCPASRAAVPTFHPRGIPTHTTLKRVTSGAPRSNPHPLSSSIRGPCGRDNKVRVCVCVCVRACVRARVCVCVSFFFLLSISTYVMILLVPFARCMKYGLVRRLPSVTRSSAQVSTAARAAERIKVPRILLYER